jgi:type II restriction enzyme
MNFSELRKLITEESKKGKFVESSLRIEEKIFSLDKNAIIPLITDLGAIPEEIGHDSSEEKLFSKVTDIFLAKCFHEIGLRATVNTERANCADVVAKSKYHNYSLVGDAKAFRLSRTAKNQKDFKVRSMVDWKKDSDYSVLVCPYYQYPKRKSQIYGQALSGNVTLFSWEYFSVLLQENVVEDENSNLSNLWEISIDFAEKTSIADKNNCFLNEQDQQIQTMLGIQSEQFLLYFKKFRSDIIHRGRLEINYWDEQIHAIKEYSREKAINELLISLKLKEKKASIKKYLTSLGA